MATISLLLTAVDKASPVMKGLGDSAKKIGAGLAAAGAVAGAAAISFGIDSVKAYAESEKAQAKLSDAFARFPKLADTNLEAMQKLNAELAKKTRFDDDATSAAQAQLAQYELTGEQILRLTPLLQDYAAKTGKDLVSASEDLGKAMLGQGRALKDVGIDFEDTGTVAGNFDQIMQGLSEKVGGFAAVDAETASGKLEILRNRFGEVQEKIGLALMPALDGIVTWLNGEGMETVEGLSGWIAEKAIPGFQGLVEWSIKWKDELGLVAGAIGIATGAQWLLNAAMLANPIGIVIAALVVAAAWIIHVMNNFEDMRVMMLTAAGNVAVWFLKMARGFNGMVGDLVNGLLNLIRPVVEAVNPLREFFNLGKITVPKFVTDNSFIDRAIANAQAIAGSATSGGGGAGGKMTAFAEGGAVTSATIALIGEGSEPEGVVPLSKFPEMVKAAGYGGDGAGGDTYIVEIHGIATSSEAELGRVFVKAVKAAQDTGLIRKVLPNA